MPPEPGTERLIIQLPFSAFSKDEHIEMLSKLPQAHTCSNTIEIPNYYEALIDSGKLGNNPSDKVVAAELKKVLGEKLRMAINETTGYELDAIDAEAGLAHEHSASGPPPFPKSSPVEEIQEVGAKTENDQKLSPFSVDPVRDIRTPVDPVHDIKTPLDSGRCTSSPSITNIPERCITSSNGQGSPQGIDDFLKDLDDVMQPLDTEIATAPMQPKSVVPISNHAKEPGVVGQSLNPAAAVTGISKGCTQPKSNVILTQPVKSAMKELESQELLGLWSPSVGQPTPATPQGRSEQRIPPGQTMYSALSPKQGGTLVIGSTTNRELPPVKARLLQGQFVPSSASPVTSPGRAGQNLLHMALVSSSTTVAKNTGHTTWTS